MINDLFSWLNTLLSGNIWIAFAGAFLWGILSILLSPCHLSTIPLVVGYISGSSGLNVRKAFNISFVFAIGILITIAVIGLVTASMGRILGDIGYAAGYIIPAVLLISGLFLLDVIKFKSFGVNTQNYNSGGYWKIFILGIIFGVGLGPCTFAFMAPVLGVVFNIAAGHMLAALVLLLLFALGHCGVIVTAGTFSKKVQIYLNWNENSAAIFRIKKIFGVLLLLFSAYLFATGVQY